MTSLFVLIGLSLFTQAQAAGPTKIHCVSEGRGIVQHLTLEGPAGIDLSNPRGLSEILLSINGAEAQIFSVGTQFTKEGRIVTYTHRHPFFISDLVLTYNIFDESLGGYETFTGTWTVDYPPVLQLNCQFAVSP